MSHLMVNFITAAIGILVLVGLDLLLGARGMLAMSRIFNRKVDVDNAVLKGLAGLRVQGEKEVVRIDEAVLRGRLRIFLAFLLLAPAALLYFVVFLRK